MDCVSLSLSTDLRSNESRADKKVTLSILRPLGHIITSSVAIICHQPPLPLTSLIVTRNFLLLVALNFATMESELELETKVRKVMMYDVYAGIRTSCLLTVFSVLIDS